MKTEKLRDLIGLFLQKHPSSQMENNVTKKTRPSASDRPEKPFRFSAEMSRSSTCKNDKI